MTKKYLIIILILIAGLFFNAFAVVDVYGTWAVNDNVIINDDVYIHSGADVYCTTWLTLTINGSLINEGTIRNSLLGYSMGVNCSGNFTNSGSVINSYFYMNGTGSQTLTTNTAISAAEFYITNTNPVVAGSDLYFLNSKIDLFPSGSIDLSSGKKLSIDGGYFYRGQIIGEAVSVPTSSLEMSNDAYLYLTTCSNLNLLGTIAGYEPVTFEGNTINKGNLHSLSWTTLTLKDNFINEGTIRNALTGHSTAINCSGNFTNSGSVINSYFYMNGTGSQTLITNTAISAGEFYITNPNPIIAGSDLYFLNSKINLSSVGSIDLSSGKKLSLDGGYFYRGNIIGEAVSVPTSSLEMSNDAYIIEAICSNLNLLGTIAGYQPVTFEGNTINKGDLYSLSGTTLTLKDNFINEGTIKNSPSGYSTTINCSGNFTNSGSVINSYFYFNGDSHQHVSILNGNAIASNEIYFTTNITNGPFQWFYNHNPILEPNPDFSGEAGQQLRWLVPVTLAYNGTFYCETGDGASKCVYVNNGTFEVPNITSITNNGTNVSIAWDAIPSAAYYRVFSSDDPYKDHYDSSWDLEADNVLANSWTALVPAGNKKFYFVAAVY